MKENIAGHVIVAIFAIGAFNLLFSEDLNEMRAAQCEEHP